MVEQTGQQSKREEKLIDTFFKECAEIDRKRLSKLAKYLLKRDEHLGLTIEQAEQLAAYMIDFLFIQKAIK